MPGPFSDKQARNSRRAVSLRSLRERLRLRKGVQPAEAGFEPCTLADDEGWVCLNERIGAANPDKRRFSLWLLVLEAKGFGFKVQQRSNTVFVLPDQAEQAAAEILEFESERYAPDPAPGPGYENWLWVLLLLSLLPLMDSLRRGAVGWQSGIWPPNAEEWIRAGAVYAAEMRQGQGLYRAFTALTMHADGAHLMGNVLAGLLFMVPLCRQVGLGYGFFITIVGGGLGNMLNVLIKRENFISMGFSTALFAALGGLCVIVALQQVFLFLHARNKGLKLSAWTNLKPALLPMAAGLAFLAMLGGSGDPDTDYGAHIMGFVAGVILGLAVGVPALERPWIAARKRLNTASRLQQAVLLLVSLGIVVLCWYVALYAYWQSYAA